MRSKAQDFPKPKPKNDNVEEEKDEMTWKRTRRKRKKKRGYSFSKIEISSRFPGGADFRVSSVALKPHIVLLPFVFSLLSLSYPTSSFALFSRF
jgi:hypothetical protein